MLARRRFLSRWIYSCRAERTPLLHCFGGSDSSELATLLRGINLLRPTALCRIMIEQRSDKSLFGNWHNYTAVYSALFNSLRNQPVRLLEMGIGQVTPGASLRGWREFFPLARVYGADLDHAVLFGEYRIRTFYCDQLDRAALRELWSQAELHQSMDAIIDDGVHTFEAQTLFIETSLEHLKPGGFLVIEDIESRTLPDWMDRIKAVYSMQCPTHEFILMELPMSQNSYDNNLLVIRRAN